jgi:hypothetical protein
MLETRLAEEVKSDPSPPVVQTHDWSKTTGKSQVATSAHQKILSNLDVLEAVHQASATINCKDARSNRPHF